MILEDEVMKNQLWKKFAARVRSEIISIPELREFLVVIFAFRFLFPEIMDKIITNKASFLEVFRLDSQNIGDLWQISWLKEFLEFNMSPSLHLYLVQKDWWWDFITKLSENSESFGLYDLSNIYELLISMRERKKTGIFFTPEHQVKIMCQYSLFFFFRYRNTFECDEQTLLNVILDRKYSNDLEPPKLHQVDTYLKNLLILDPSCGVGVFLAEMFDLVVTLIFENPLRRQDSFENKSRILIKILSNFYGYDIDLTSVMLTKIALCKKWIQFNGTEDYSKRDLDNLIKKALRIDNKDFLLEIDSNIKRFDICIGNPPYLRHHDISRNDLRKYRSIQRYFSDLNLQWDKKADLYMYFWLSAIALLKNKGILTLVLSRSWFSSRFGIMLDQVFQKHFHLDLILEFPFEIWSNAEIKTHIVVGHSFSPDRISKKIQYLVWKKNIEEFYQFKNFDLHLNECKKSILSFNGEKVHIRSIETSKHRLTELSNLTPLLIKKKTIFPLLRIDYLGISPFLLQDILIEFQDQFCLLRELGKIQMGSTTGINKYFYLKSDSIKKFDIPENYLYPMTKSPKEWDTIYGPTNKNELMSFLYVKETITDNTHFKLKEYLDSIREEVLERPYFKNKNEDNWYKIPLLQPDLLLPNMIYRRSFVAYNRERLHIDKQWIGFWVKEKRWIFSILAFFNSSLGVLFREIQGTKTLGLGALKISLQEYRDMFVLDPRKIPQEISEKLGRLVVKLGKIKIRTNDNSSYYNIQRSIDRIILVDYLGLNESVLKKIQEILEFEQRWRLVKENTLQINE